MSEMIDGRYELIEVIASGGMATVWRARDTRLDRDVAIKRPHPTPADDPRHDRMLREARTAAAISHPNLVTIFDAGSDQNGLFMAMELVEGQTLEAAASSLSSSEICDIGAQVADALATIHSKGIVHRDVKPANILMSERGPQLTDFGLALSGDQTRLTQPGQVMATPSYAAPEVIAGQPPTAASDVFSLGVTMFRLLKGGDPFAGTDRTILADSTGDAGLDELLLNALSEDPEMRPEAASFASRLRDSTPTRVIGASGGSTIPMATAPPSLAPGGLAKDKKSKGSSWWLAAALMVLLILTAVALATRDDEAALASETTTTSTSVTTPSTTSPTTTAPTIPSSTTPEPAQTVVTARAELEAALAAIHPSVLKPKDMRSIMKKVDDAISASEDSDDEEASKKLNDAAKDIERKLDDDDVDEILEALEDLASLIGVDLEE